MTAIIASNSHGDCKVTAIPAFDDNYIWCMHDDRHAYVVDPGDAKPVKAFLDEHHLVLEGILITHHHFDHVGGIDELSQLQDAMPVYGPNNPKIKGITHPLREGQQLRLAKLAVNLRVLETPGHTLDHIVYYNDELLFCGDTLFSAGCGRMFEGTAPVFLDSLNKLAALPEHTAVYCTHEYTLANLKFAQHVDPHNTVLNDYSAWAQDIRAQNKITLPSNIKTQKQINPFLRSDQALIQKNIAELMNLSPGTNVETFAALRACKDNF